MTSKNTIEEKLNTVREYLRTGNAQKALGMLEKESHHPDLLHARGVCLLRLNKIDSALDIFREVVFGKFVSIPASTPPLYKANYLTALLLNGFTQMAMEIEETLKPEDHPYVAKVKAAVKEWKKSLPIHQRAMCMIKLYPNRTFDLTFVPGEI